MEAIRSGEATIFFERVGSGPALLALAPGGLRASRASSWAYAPWNPMAELSDRFEVFGIDQRNTGTSWAPITSSDSWSSYTADQLAVLDAAGVDEFAVIGMCIGGAFIMDLLRQAPDRVNAAVLLQPIGFDRNRDEFREIFDEWRADIGDDHPEATDADWEGCWTNLFGADQVMWSVSDEFVATVDVPLLVCQGGDVYHPASTSRFLARTAPHATLIEQWTDGDDVESARSRVREFLVRHHSVSR